MKTASLLKNLKLVKTVSRIALVTVICMCACSVSFAYTGKLDFRNSKLISGTAGANGAIYKFSNVGNDLDALVKIIGRSDALVYLVNIDMTSTGFDKAWQPQVGFNKNKNSKLTDWYMDFELTFVKRGTSTPVNIDEFDLTAIDIDGNGSNLNEYVSYNGLKSYVTETNSLLSVSKIFNVVNGVNKVTGAKFIGPVKNFANIDTNATAVMVSGKYVVTQNFTIRTGASSKITNASDERMYSFYFKEFRYIQPSQATLPVKLKSFDAKLFSSKVVLDWETSEEINFSHFMIQRSVDGNNFDDVTMIFSNAHASDYNYTYSETLKPNTSGSLYYRLKMVDADGSFKFSPIKMVKIGQNENIVVSAFPNPASTDVKIMIPATWQNRQVVYDMVNMNGVVVKHNVKERAGQIETLQVNDIMSGVYFIRLKSGDQSSVLKIVKK